MQHWSLELRLEIVETAIEKVLQEGVQEKREAMSERASFRDVCEERRDNHFSSCSLLFRATTYNLGKTPQLAVPKGRY